MWSLSSTRSDAAVSVTSGQTRNGLSHVAGLVAFDINAA